MRKLTIVFLHICYQIKVSCIAWLVFLLKINIWKCLTIYSTYFSKLGLFIFQLRFVSLTVFNWEMCESEVLGIVKRRILNCAISAFSVSFDRWWRRCRFMYVYLKIWWNTFKVSSYVLNKEYYCDIIKAIFTNNDFMLKKTCLNYSFLYRNIVKTSSFVLTKWC